MPFYRRRVDAALIFIPVRGLNISAPCLEITTLILSLSGAPGSHVGIPRTLTSRALFTNVVERGSIAFVTVALETVTAGRQRCGAGIRVHLLA